MSIFGEKNFKRAIFVYFETLILKIIIIDIFVAKLFRIDWKYQEIKWLKQIMFIFICKVEGTSKSRVL